jgi:SpoVK/Ycf46/Vps4 family AAA+-type ATPase
LQIDKQHRRDLSFRPRVLITGRPGQALSTYVGPAILHHLERLPCHILDLATLFSNSARTAEENLCRVFHEAKRTVPSVLYVPNLSELCMNETVKQTFLSLLSGVQPTAPLLVRF